MFVAKPMEVADLVGGMRLPAAVPASTATALLTARLRTADEDAYREFYDLYARRLHAYLFVISRGNEALAAELLQETMLRVARYIRVFEDEEIFWGWLTNLARSCAIDEGRKRNRYLAMLQRFWDRLTSEHSAEAPSSSVTEEILALLPEEERTLLEQKYLHGLSVKELALFCGASEKAIESRLTRARQRLKELISSRKEP